MVKNFHKNYEKSLKKFDYKLTLFGPTLKGIGNNSFAKDAQHAMRDTHNHKVAAFHECNRPEETDSPREDTEPKIREVK